MLKIIYLIFFMGLIATIASANDSFILESIDEAKHLAKLTNKPLLIIFGSESCAFCNTLKQDIMTKSLSPNVDRYIICYIDIQKDQALKKQYNVSIIPDSRIFVEEKEKHKLKGYTKNNYLQWLNNVQ